MTPARAYDVAIMGGGLAGLCLGLQLERARPGCRVLIIEKRTGAAPEAAFKVGESAVELASWYFAEVLGLGDHLHRFQLPKFGLRYFMSAGDNRDISRRFEFGPLRFDASASAAPDPDPGQDGRRFQGLPVPAYNLDRGRLENHLATLCRAAGIEFLQGARVTDIELGQDSHTLTLSGDDAPSSVRARWLVDASGRASILKRRFDLAETTDHRVDAVWFRLACEIDPDEWSTDRTWLGRTQPGLRRLSTIHLMGRGYWVWLIPLASGCTSVGIVVDASRHSIGEINTFERALAWLHQREPQCARAVEDARALLRDFHIMRGGAYGCRKLFSTERWAITGDAGVYLDPLYSPGSDFIAVSNTLITDLIARDLDGQRMTGAVHFSEALFQGLFQQYLLLYNGQYEIMGSPRVMTAKVVWDTALYFGYTLLLFRNGRLCDRSFFVHARAQVKATLRLQGTMQALFRRWARYETVEGEGRFVDQRSLAFLWELYIASKRSYDEPELLQRLRRNMTILETFARELTRCARGDLAQARPMTRPMTRSASRSDLESAEEDTIDLRADMSLLWPD